MSEKQGFECPFCGAVYIHARSRDAHVEAMKEYENLPDEKNPHKKKGSK